MAGMSMVALLVVIGVAGTLGIGVVIAILLALGARTSTQDVTEEPPDSGRHDPARPGTKETP